MSGVTAAPGVAQLPALSESFVSHKPPYFHHCAENESPNGFQAAHGLPHRSLAGVLRIRYEQNSVPLGSEYGGVGDHAYGGCINHNVVELFSEACKELREAPGA